MFLFFFAEFLAKLWRMGELQQVQQARKSESNIYICTKKEEAGEVLM